MRHTIISLVLCILIGMLGTSPLCGQSITLFNEIDSQTGHDNHMIAVQMFGDRSEITYCHGTELKHLLPLIRNLQHDSSQPVTLRLVAYHEFELNRRGWVIIGVCNSIKDSDPGILVYSSRDVAKSMAMSLGRSFRPMRKVPVVYRPRDELVTFFTNEESNETHVNSPSPLTKP